MSPRGARVPLCALGKAAQAPGVPAWGRWPGSRPGQGKPTLAPCGARAWHSARAGQPKRQVSPRGGVGLAHAQGSPTKTRSDHFLINHPFNAKCILVKRQLHPSPAALATLCGKGWAAITLLQFTMFWV